VVQPFIPPPTLVTAVIRQSSHDLVWYFDHDISADGDAEPALAVVFRTGPTSTTQFLSNAVYCAYLDIVSVGDHWRITLLPTHVTSSPAIAIPQSGQVIGP
jgi:hypothetical protein